MTVKRKQQPGSSGIVVAGTSKAEATQLFIAVAKGLESVELQDNEKRTFVTHASAADLFNPLSGAQDLVKVEGESGFTAVASDTQQLVCEYTICADGCGSHIMSQSSDLKFCPSCSTELPELSDAEIEALSNDEVGDDTQEDNAEHHVVVAADSGEEARELFAQAFAGEEAVAYTSESGTFITHASADFKFDPIEGSEELTKGEVTEEMQSLSSASGDEVKAHLYVCSHSGECGKTIISTSSSAIACPSCGGGLLDPADAASLDSLSGDLEALEAAILASESGDDEDDEDESEEDFDLDDEDDDMADLDDEEDESEEDDLESESSEDDLEEDLDEEDEEDEDDLESESADEDEGDEEDEDDLDGLDMDDLDDEEDMDDEDEDDLESESAEKQIVADLNMDLLSAIAASEPEGLNPKRFFVANCGVVDGDLTWTAFYKNTPVAIATASSVKGTALQEVIETAKFGQAVIATANADGVEQALEDFAFKRINPELNIPAVVEAGILAQADDRVREITQTYEADHAQYADRFLAAVATASMGINRGVFKGVTNPVANRIISALAAAGVSNPELIVHSAFEQKGDELNRMVLEQASALVAKPLDSQNSIAEMVANAAHQPMQSESSTVEDRLANWKKKPATPAAAPVEFESQSSGRQKGHKYLNLLSKN